MPLMLSMGRMALTISSFSFHGSLFCPAASAHYSAASAGLRRVHHQHHIGAAVIIVIPEWSIIYRQSTQCKHLPGISISLGNNGSRSMLVESSWRLQHISISADTRVMVYMYE